jgi:TRAP-type C4-dicarboxylate transport system substrate-binding protein
MKCTRLVCLSIAIVLMLVFGSAVQAGDKITLRWAHYIPNQPDIFVKADQYFADKVKEKTNGRVEIQVFYGQTLGKVKELMGLVSEGTVDIASFPTGYFASAFPLWAAPNSLPFTMSTLDEAYNTGLDLLPKCPGAQQEIADQNLKLLFHHVLAPYQVFSTKPIAKFEDLKGLKVRTWGTYMPEAFGAAGAVAVNVLPAEVYEALKRGVVDAAMWPLELGWLQKHHEVAPNICMWNIGSFVGHGNWINLEKWNSLPPDVQQIMIETAKEASKVELDMRAKMDQVARQKLTEAGVNFIEIAPEERQKWVDACPKFMDKWQSEMEGQGLGDQAKQMKAEWLKILGR